MKDKLLTDLKAWAEKPELSGAVRYTFVRAYKRIAELEKTLEQTEECYATLITTEIEATAKLDAVQWQPIESPPAEAGMYLCLLKNGCHVLYGQPDKWFEPYEVTHWMPLSEPPQALNGEDDE